MHRKTIKNIIQKTFVGMMSLAMVIPAFPITVNAENNNDTPVTTVAPDAANTITEEKSDDNVVKIETPTTSPDSTPQATIEPENNKNQDNVNSGDSQKDESKKQKKETSDDISSYFQNETNKESEEKLYKFLKKYTDKDIENETPSFNLSLTGMGTVRVIREDGSYTEYRFDTTEPKNYDSAGNFVATDYTPVGDAVPSYVYSYTGKSKYESEEYLKHPVYYITGAENEKVHITITSDEGDQIYSAYEENTATTLRDEQFASYVNPDKKQTSYEFDHVFQKGTSDSLTVSFTDNNYQIPAVEATSQEELDKFKQAKEEYKKEQESKTSSKETSATFSKNKLNQASVNLKQAMAGGNTSGSGTMTIHALTYTSIYLNNKDWGDRLGADRFASQWYADTNDVHGDPTFQALLNEAGGRLVLYCNQEGTPAPKMGRAYDFSWQMTTDSTTGNRHVTVRLYSDRVTWNTFYTVDLGEVSNYCQGGTASFDLKPAFYDLKVSLKKEVTDPAILAYMQENKISLSGAVFEIYGSDGSYLGTTAPTDSNGNTSFSQSHVQTSVSSINIKQIKAPDGLQIAGPWTQDVYISGKNGTVNFVDLNEAPTEYPVTAHKQDSVTGQELSGATFTMVGVTTGKTYTVSSEQTINVWAGSYYVTETDVPDGYYRDGSTQTVTVKANSSNSFTFKDVPIQYDVIKIIQKKNDDPNETQNVGDPMIGAVLQLRDTDATRTPLETWTTDGTNHRLGTGTLLNGWSGKLKHGHKYEIVELSVPAGWEIITDPQPVTISDCTPDSFTNGITNVISFGNIELNYAIRKVDADVPVKTVMKDGQPVIDPNTNKPQQEPNRVAGAHLQLFERGNSQVLDDWITSATSDHHIKKELLKVNHTYVVHEVEPSVGYYMPARDLEFKAVNTGGELSVQSVQEYPIKINILKVDADTLGPLDGVTLQLYDKAEPGTKLYEWKSKLTAENLSYESTNADGTRNYRNLLKAGHTYQVVETETVDGYYLNETPKEFTVSKQSFGRYEKDPIEIKIENHPITAYVGKLDGITLKPLAGATLEVRNHTVFATILDILGIKTQKPHTMVSFQSISSGDGTVSLAKLKEKDGKPVKVKAGGQYELIETKAPDGYYMDSSDENPKIFTIPSTWEEAKREWTNGKVTVFVKDYAIKVAFRKVDENGNYVAGARLSLHQYAPDTDNKLGAIIANWKTTKSDMELSGAPSVASNYGNTVGLVCGKTYILHEDNEAPGHYRANDIVFTIPKTLQGEALEKAMRGEATPVQIVGSGNTVQSIDAVTMVDEQIRWRLRKTDKDGNLLTFKNKDHFEFKVYKMISKDQKDTTFSTITLSTADSNYITKGYWEIEPTQLEAGGMYQVEESHTPHGWIPAHKAYLVTLPSIPTETMTDINIGDSSQWYNKGENENFGNERCIGTTMVNYPFHLYFNKQDQDGKLLTYYEDQSDLQQNPFVFYIFDRENNKIATFNTGTEEYRTDKHIDLSKYLTWGETYTIREVNKADKTGNDADAYPYGYYRAPDKAVTFTTDEVTDGQTISITMTDPKISARFRKEDQAGNPIAYVNADGVRVGKPEKYNFIVYDITDPANHIPVKSFNLLETDNRGYIQLGDVVQEGHNYRIDETSHPKEVAARKDENGNEIFPSIYFNIPTYYDTGNPVQANPKSTSNPTLIGSSWVFDENGNKIRYRLANGDGSDTQAFATNTWLEFGDDHYHFNKDGYLDKNKGIQDEDGTMYYVDGDGLMVRNTWVGVNHYGDDGKCDHTK